MFIIQSDNEHRHVTFYNLSVTGIMAGDGLLASCARFWKVSQLHSDSTSTEKMKLMATSARMLPTMLR